MLRRTTLPQSGLTILEILMAMFVLLIGVTGVIALFPIGVRLSQTAADDTLGAMTAQNALAAIRTQVGLANRVKAYTADPANTTGDVLCWVGTAPQQSKGIEAITGTVSTVGTTAVGDPLGLTKINVSLAGTDSRTLQVKQQGGLTAINATDCGLLLITSGNATWKLYRLDDPNGTSNFSNSQLASTQNASTSFPGDAVKSGDSFRLLGARDEKKVWATVPANFFSNDSGVQNTTFVLGVGAARGYGYLAILTRLKGYSDTFRVDILVYKGYDRTLPPEGNQPAVACYTTILSAGMLK